jgi:hypothetical protein
VLSTHHDLEAAHRELVTRLLAVDAEKVTESVETQATAQIRTESPTFDGSMTWAVCSRQFRLRLTKILHIPRENSAFARFTAEEATDIMNIWLSFGL